MRALHEKIKEKVNELDVYKTIDLYDNQDQNLNDRNEEHIFFPACLIEYEVTNINRLAYGVKDVYLNVRFRFLYENYTVTRLDDLDRLEEFSAHMTNFRGGQNDDIQFTSFEEISREYDENHDMLNIPVITFLTVYRDTSAYKEKTVVYPSVNTNVEIQ